MFTTYFLNMIAGNTFGTQTTPALPTAFYLGLSTTTPNADGTGATEPTEVGNAYERIELDNLSAPNEGYVENESSVAFEESMSAWGTVTHYLVFDAATGGNLLMYEPLDEQRSVEARTVMLFKAGEIRFGIENAQA